MLLSVLSPRVCADGLCRPLASWGGLGDGGREGKRAKGVRSIYRPLSAYSWDQYFDGNVPAPSLVSHMM